MSKAFTRIIRITMLMCCLLVIMVMLASRWLLPANTLQFYTQDRTGIVTYQYTLTTGAFQELEHHRALGFVAPDGSRMAIIERDYRGFVISLADADGDNPHELGVFDVHPPLLQLIWRDDETILVMDRRPALTRIMAINVDTGNMEIMTEQHFLAGTFFYARQQNTVIITRFSSNFRELHIVNLNTNTSEVLRDVGIFELSSDASRIAYTNWDYEYRRSVDMVTVHDLATNETRTLMMPESERIVSMLLMPNPDEMIISFNNPDMTYSVTLSTAEFIPLHAANMLLPYPISPNGRYIIGLDTAQGFRQGAQMQYLMLDTIDQKLVYSFLSDIPFLPAGMAWSDDSKQFAFVNGNGLNITLEIFSATNGEREQILNLLLPGTILPAFLSSESPLAWLPSH